MHYSLLVALEIPEIIEDQAENQKVEKCLEELKEAYKQYPENWVLEMQIRRLSGLTTEFARTVAYEVGKIMESYDAYPEDPKYLKFDDRTEQLNEAYLNNTIDCIRLPNGTILKSIDLQKNFVIADGKISQTYAGPLHHMKRTKKSKKMMALIAYPYAKLFKTFEEYAEDRGVSFNEKKDRYGYWYNPNEMWDEYSIGGRWADMFLVKDTCTEFSLGKRSWWNSKKEYEVPEGYMWVCAARKKDIDWKRMREWNVQKITKHYEKLKHMFEANKMDGRYRGYITDKGIFDCGECAYRKGESLEEFMQRRGTPKEWRHPRYFHDIVDKNDWQCVDDFRDNAEQQKSWHTILDEYIDSLSDDTVLVGVDYHI